MVCLFVERKQGLVAWITFSVSGVDRTKESSTSIIGLKSRVPILQELGISGGGGGGRDNCRLLRRCPVRCIKGKGCQGYRVPSQDAAHRFARKFGLVRTY